MYHEYTIWVRDKGREKITFASDERPSKIVVQKCCERTEIIAPCKFLHIAKSFSIRLFEYHKKRNVKIVRGFPFQILNHDPPLTKQ